MCRWPMSPPNEGGLRARRRNLLVVRAGDESLHPTWLRGDGSKTFDLMVSYFGECSGRYKDRCDFYHVMKGPRWPAHDEICRAHPALIAQYDHVAFVCDDIVAAQADWDRLFGMRLDLAQPAVRGHLSHAITAPVDGCLLRFTNFVEIMCPVFSRRALARVKSSFCESRSGWGLDLVWPQWLQGLQGQNARIAIVDAVQVEHGRPLREGTLYPLLAKLGVDPMAERNEVFARLNLHPMQLQEITRIVSVSA
jgi:hypothetical protein